MVFTVRCHSQSYLSSSIGDSLRFGRQGKQSVNLSSSIPHGPPPCCNICRASCLPKKGVTATKPSDMGEKGQCSKGQKAAVNRHICQEIFSFFTSSSGIWSYRGLWYSGNTNSSHAAPWTPNKDLTGCNIIKEALNHQSYRSKIWRG